jgi:hypothetical protein
VDQPFLVRDALALGISRDVLPRGEPRRGGAERMDRPT